ncbi:MAG: toprim domain-containing protein [Emcibacter sp.]|nr:toprim domain-containing protein [Emcibacter sp.]
MKYNSADIKAMLEQHWETLIKEIFPLAQRHGGYYCVGSLDGEAGSSLVLWTGQRAGAWKDYNGSAQGDAFNLIQEVYGLDFPASIEWATGFLGMSGGPENFEVKRKEAAKASKKRNETATAQNEENRVKAEKIWLHGNKFIKGSPADAYLQGRGIDLRRMKKQPGALRYHPECWHHQSRSAHPAMVLAVTDPSKPVGQRFRAVHKTYLKKDDRKGWLRIGSSEIKGKLVKGLYVGASIPIWRGTSGKTLVDMPKGEPVYITEGPEDAFTLALVNPNARVLCAVSLANLANVWLPPQVGDVVLLKDNDWDNPKAEAGFQRAIDAHQEAGRIVRVMTVPRKSGKDVNDWLNEGNE